MRRVGVIGDPVQHSLSPHMHNAALEALGIDAVYELWHTPLAGLPDRIVGLRAGDDIGANVTVPHKQAIMPLIDGVSDTARQIGAVNTLVRRDDGLYGDNTDAFGFLQSIESAYPGASFSTAVILGAGGASRAVIVALKLMGLQKIAVTNRTPERAVTLACEFEADAMPWDAVIEALPHADMLINATSLGWHDEMPIEVAALDRLPEGALVMDLTYRETPLLREAARRGLRSLDGLGMLIHQGARAFELWFDQPAPVAVMRDAVLAEQARRG
jgi:shikimate dehydrogenase